MSLLWNHFFLQSKLCWNKILLKFNQTQKCQSHFSQHKEIISVFKPVWFLNAECFSSCRKFPHVIFYSAKTFFSYSVQINSFRCLLAELFIRGQKTPSQTKTGFDLEKLRHESQTLPPTLTERQNTSRFSFI